MARKFQFDEFTLDESHYSLQRGDRVLRLEKRPMELLLLLVDRQGELVSRDEIAEKLWGTDVFVDVDHSINTAVRKVRQVLRDDPEKPRYVETVVGKGYRFAAPVVCSNGTSNSQVEVQAPRPAVLADSSLATAPSLPSVAIAVEPPAEMRPEKSRVPRLRWLWVALAAIALLGVGAIVTGWLPPSSAPIVEEVTQLTDDGVKKANLFTDGERIYFNYGNEVKEEIGEVSVKGGPTAVIPTPPLTNPILVGVAPDGSYLASVDDTGEVQSHSVWKIPLPAGEPHRLAGLGFYGGTVTPDGRFLLFREGDLFLTDKDGANPQKIISLKKGNIGTAAMSPDGRRIAFTEFLIGDPEIYIVNSDGSGLEPVAKSSEPGGFCCPQWTADGQYIVFWQRSTSKQNLWYLRMNRGWLQPPNKPMRLTAGPISYFSPVPSRNGKTVFASGQRYHGELLRLDLQSKKLVPYLGGISIVEPTFSRDGKWMAYTSYPEHSLWRSRSDGSERLQLTYPPLEVGSPQISPDGTQVVFQTTNGPGTYVISTNGAAPQKVLDMHSDSANWSPDGNQLVFSDLEKGWSNPEIKTLDMHSGQISLIPGGLYGASWIGPGKILAYRHDVSGLQIYDLATGQWSDFINFAPDSLAMGTISPDLQYFYYLTRGFEMKLFRVRISDQRSEYLTSLRGFNFAAAGGAYAPINIAPDGSPLFTRELSTPEIYALTVKWP